MMGWWWWLIKCHERPRGIQTLVGTVFMMILSPYFKWLDVLVPEGPRRVENMKHGIVVVRMWVLCLPTRRMHWYTFLISNSQSIFLLLVFMESTIELPFPYCIHIFYWSTYPGTLEEEEWRAFIRTGTFFKYFIRQQAAAALHNGRIHSYHVVLG